MGNERGERMMQRWMWVALIVVAIVVVAFVAYLLLNNPTSYSSHVTGGTGLIPAA